MAFYIFKIKHFPFPKPLILFYLLIITSFFSVPSPFTSALNFSFPNFNFDDYHIIYDKAIVEDSVIQLTGNSSSVKSELQGRATYFNPMHLWDKASGNLTDFTTHFIFAIDSQNKTNYGDGLAFFLAPTDSTIPYYNLKEGATMGLARDDQLLNSTSYPFVAVEFDIYPNEPMDPPGEHVGIDINSFKSVANVSWWGGNYSILQGENNEAWISYNSNSHNLSVLFTPFVGDSFSNATTAWQSLSFNVDLRHYLPEWVTFGFSAATGNASAMHTIRTWDFSSTLEDTLSKPTMEGNMSQNPASNRNKNKRGIGGTQKRISPLIGPWMKNFKGKQDPTNQVVMVEWVWELYGLGKVLEAVDPRLGGDFDEQQMEHLMIVGLWCAHTDRNLRPTIRQTTHVLNFEAPLPILPSNMPGTTPLALVANRHPMPLSMSSAVTDYEEGRNPFSSDTYTNSSLSAS
ncbi:hypothetical protein FH972_004817 [Carpinus fangiana]|uniref:Legume lectin domain-containing protein n=1 Tax=Carpinus fangiana TaxID=176857 RepID=A0A5N6QME4_9ROSI|nr:hypothetical protein FH972_004817 [Carpinus fangiana]